MINEEVTLTLEDAVAEVLGLLTGLDLEYNPNQDTFQIVTRFLNQSLRRNALEHSWSFYSSLESVGTTVRGQDRVHLLGSVRPRIDLDDSVRFVNPKTGAPEIWAYYLPREAIHKYRSRKGMWVASDKNELIFSRPVWWDKPLVIQVPVMREPIMFRLPPQSHDPEDPIVDVPEDILKQEVDFYYPDLIVARAAFMYAQTDPVAQPRVQTLEAEYKDIMYQLKEREEQHTDSPYMNEFNVPILNGIYDGRKRPLTHRHPHADERA